MACFRKALPFSFVINVAQVCAFAYEGHIEGFIRKIVEPFLTFSVLVLAFTF